MKVEVLVYEDNESAIRIANRVNTHKFRTILGASCDAENHFDSFRRATVCEAIQLNKIELVKVTSENQIANVLTKAVDQRK